jgi:hypothetical protein
VYTHIYRFFFQLLMDRILVKSTSSPIRKLRLTGSMAHPRPYSRMGAALPEVLKTLPYQPV